jgi:hypothetical protein
MPNTYCVYQAQQSSPHTNPPIRSTDMFCVDCPDDGSCRGTVGQPVSIKIKDKDGKEASLKAVLQNASCTDCPDGAHKGYSFAPKQDGNGGWL